MAFHSNISTFQVGMTEIPISLSLTIYRSLGQFLGSSVSYCLRERFLPLILIINCTYFDKNSYFLIVQFNNTFVLFWKFIDSSWVDLHREIVNCTLIQRYTVYTVHEINVESKWQVLYLRWNGDSCKLCLMK